MNNLAPEMRQRVLNQRGESGSEDEDEEEDEDDEPGTVAWGKKKKTYYSGDTADLEIGQDVEDALEEEEAAKDLYKSKLRRMTEKDFLGEDSDDNDEEEAEEEEEGELTLGDQLKHKQKAKRDKSRNLISQELEALALRQQSGEDAEEVEKVAKSLSHLSKEQRLDLLARQAPELRTIVAELRDRVEELESRIVPVRDLAVKLAAIGYVEDDLVSYLEMKQQLLLAYCLDVAFYLYMKAQGRSLRSHPVMKQLLRLRYAMEKIYSLDGKLKHQVDRLLKLAEGGLDAKTLESSMLKPNLAALLGEDDEDDENGSDNEEEDSDEDESKGRDGVYRPPKLTSTPYPEDGKVSAKEAKRLERQKKRFQDSELFESLREDFGSAPEESGSGGMAHVSGDLKRLEQEEAERRAFEEERFIRMTLTKKEKNAMKRRALEAMRVDNFEDLGDASVLDNLSSDLVPATQSKKRSNMVSDGAGEEAARALERAVSELNGGKRQRRAAPALDAPTAFGSDDEGEDGANLFDDFVSKKKTYLAKKAEHYTVEPKFGREQEVVDEGQKRAASYEIIKNRGLTPHRKKENRNARVKKREAYAKAVIRRKGQVREAAGRADVGYMGELTGIKANLSHSRKMA